MNTEHEDCCCDAPYGQSKPFDWRIGVGIVITGLVIGWFLSDVIFKPNKPSPPSPIQSTQITMFNVGACQYVLVGQDKALAVVHRGDCSNHLWQDFTELR